MYVGHTGSSVEVFGGWDGGFQYNVIGKYFGI